jgi:hypothetical protein
MSLLLIPIVAYSMLCAPALCFRLFPDADYGEPEVAFGYFMFCVIGGASLIPAVWRLWCLAKGKAVE